MVEYFSESRGEWMKLEDMHPKHILNLLKKMILKQHAGEFKVKVSVTA